MTRTTTFPMNLIVAAALGAAFASGGCNDRTTPTEVPAFKYTPGPTPVPPKTWTGTFTGVSVSCNSNASVVYGPGAPLPTEANVPCLGGRIFLSISRQGTTLTGYALWGDPEFYPITGTLTDSAMDFTIFNGTDADFPPAPTGPMGRVHLQP